MLCFTADRRTELIDWRGKGLDNTYEINCYKDKFLKIKVAPFYMF